jgi:hypothetical protein
MPGATSCILYCVAKDARGQSDTGRNQVLPTIAIANAEFTVTVDASAMPNGQATIQLQSVGTAMLFHDKSGQVVGDGWPVPVGVVLTIRVKHGDVFYLAGVGAGFVHFLVVDR